MDQKAVLALFDQQIRRGLAGEPAIASSSVVHLSIRSISTDDS